MATQRKQPRAAKAEADKAPAPSTPVADAPDTSSMASPAPIHERRPGVPSGKVVELPNGTIVRQS